MDMENRRTTIKDIADAVGVSTALVSFVMNNKGNRYRVSEEMTKKIKAAAVELNYQPNNAARSLRSGRTWTIGVIVSDISNKFFADIARCIEDKAYEYNYTVIFGSSDENARKLENLIHVLMNKGVDGLIIVPCEGSEKAILQVKDMRMPVVLLDRYLENTEISYVVLNNRKAMSMAVEQLIESGYRRIEMISYNLNITNVREREQGYLETMQRHKLSSYTRIHKIRFKNIPGNTEEVVNDILKRRQEVEAIVFATNTLTLAGLKALNHSGLRIPDEIAIVGFDGSEAFELYYTSITYIRQPIEQFGWEALSLLMKSINDYNPTKVATVTLSPEIVEGKSSVKLLKHNRV